jgi:hypothetical protein
VRLFHRGFLVVQGICTTWMLSRPSLAVSKSLRAKSAASHSAKSKRAAARRLPQFVGRTAPETVLQSIVCPLET